MIFGCGLQGSEWLPIGAERGRLRAINQQGREDYAQKRVTSYPEIP